LLYDDLGSPVTISLYGPGSKVYRQAIADMQDRMLKRGKKQPSAAAMREENVQLLVACSFNSENLVRPVKDEDGNEVYKPVRSAADFKAVYDNPAFGWLKDQVSAAMDDVSNFLEQ
jgi:hypothetical protein